MVLALFGCPSPRPANRSPTANAGADQMVSAGSMVTLDGSGSSDPRGRALTFQWQQTDGFPTVALVDPNTAIATFPAPNQATTLTFQLTVNNGAWRNGQRHNGRDGDGASPGKSVAGRQRWSGPDRYRGQHGQLEWQRQ